VDRNIFQPTCKNNENSFGQCESGSGDEVEMTNTVRELSKFILAGSSSVFILWLSTVMYGDKTVTQYALLITGIYFVGVSIFALACSYFVEKK
jgi:hypothetical protein